MRPLMRMAIFVPVVLVLCAGCQQQPVNVKGGPADRAEPKQAAEQTNKYLEGTLSCSGRGCHASLDQSKADADPLPCAFSLWSDDDPHAQAWDVLSNTAKGRQMSKLLHPEAADKQGEPTAVAKDPRCLACHVTPQAADPAAKLRADEKGVAEEWRFGVGCEACHGRAKDWLVPHYRDKWKTKNVAAAEKEKLGFNDLSDLRKRAMVCAGCHVGAPADEGKKLPLRDMNHDHVAAGHPRLMFEFAAFLANEPKHWKEKSAGKDFAARAWLVGQFASAEAAARLTADRARAAGKDDKNRPWPELTEYDCYACHQKLALDSWRKDLPLPGNRPGRFRPSRWYTGLLDLLDAFRKSDDSLAKLELSLRQPYPRPDEVHNLADAVAKTLSAEPIDVSGKQFPAVRQALIARGRELGRLTWDECEQVALGLLALDRAAGDKEAKESKAILKLLAFPKEYDHRPGFREIERGKADPRPFDKQWADLFGKLK